MASERGSRKDKNQNIQVFVRLRPLNQREKDIKSLGVVEVVNNREVVVRQSQQTSHTKKFTFDKAFGPLAKQVEVYQDVVSPLIEEVLAGYNCTVFAYGQTGTGKTHTMVGEHTGDSTTWQNDPLAGIIPRALSQLFDELRLSNTEYTVRVSYLELYNEELVDLLSGSEDNSKLRIYEDVTRKGSNIVNGLEEITVYNKSEVYKIMAQGQERKRVACTLMNAQSSRSHTVFTIVVHMKENSPEGEELVKIGKLNLVDLAGSENISKAGSDNPARRERARECVNINQSLLTLGRVITALVERHPHIPYRESKLTRILQESLGGRTKTSIIATVSPGHKDLEETMSTLEYANRAKNIQNKPEINQKMTKKAILKEYAEEIDRLKLNLQAARDKNGVYLANETFTEMTLKQGEQRKEIQELLLQQRAMEEERDKMTAVFGELSEQLENKERALRDAARRLGEAQGALDTTSRMLKTTKLHFEEQQHLVNKQRETELALGAQAQRLLDVAETAAGHAAGLHDAVERRRTVEAANLEVTRSYRAEAAQLRADIQRGEDAHGDQLAAGLEGMCEAGESHSTESVQQLEQNKNTIEELLGRVAQAVADMRSLTERSQEALASQISSKRDELHLNIKRHSDAVESLLNEFCAAAAEAARRGGSVEENGRENMDKFVKQWYTSSSARMTSLRSAQSQLLSAWRLAERSRAEAERRQRGARRKYGERRGTRLRACIEEITEERAQMEERLQKQLSSLDTDRKDTEDRLLQWEQEERRIFEERIERTLREQREVAAERREKRMAELEEERRLLEERMDKHIKWQEEQLQMCQEEEEHEAAAASEEQAGAHEAAAQHDKFHKVLDEESSAISIDMEAFSRNVVEIVEHITREMMGALEAARDQLEHGAKEVVSSEKSAAEGFAAESSAALGALQRAARAAGQRAVRAAEEHNASTAAALSTVAASCASLAASRAAHCASQASAARALQAGAARRREALAQQLRRQHELEARRLQQEYVTYAPSGATPMRQEYRFPRALAATSPHERILARFRAMRASGGEDECVVVDSDADGRSDSECSVSSDSAVFAAPSPPSPPALRAERGGSRPLQPIVKCTSESDIFVIRKQQQQGKENTEVTQSSKKPSRLPAPSSHKKPLGPSNNAS